MSFWKTTLPGVDCEVAADLEGVDVGLADLQQIARRLHVLAIGW